MVIFSPYLALNREVSEHGRYELRAVFNAVRWLVRSDASWCMMPQEFPPWSVVYQQDCQRQQRKAAAARYSLLFRFTPFSE